MPLKRKPEPVWESDSRFSSAPISFIPNLGEHWFFRLIQIGLNDFDKLFCRPESVPRWSSNTSAMIPFMPPRAEVISRSTSEQSCWLEIASAVSWAIVAEDAHSELALEYTASPRGSLARER